MALYLGIATAWLVLAAPVAADDPAASAKKFVERLYGKAEPMVPDEETYTPELAALIERAGELASKNDDPDLAGNALCDCQDMEGLRTSISVVSATPAAASVRVVLTGGVDGPARFLLKLVHGRKGWRLADSIAQPGGSYAANLRTELAGH